MADRFQRILDKIAEMHVDVEIIKKDISYIKEEDAKQNDLLAEHIQGVKTNKARLDLEIENRRQQHKETLFKLERLEQRLKDAEFFPKFMINLRKSIIWIAVPAGSILAILKYFNVI